MILHYSSYSVESLDNPVFSHVVASVMEGKITSRNTQIQVTQKQIFTFCFVDFWFQVWSFYGLSSGSSKG